MLSSNSCGEVYEIAGKLISIIIRLPQNNKSTVPLHVAEPFKKYNGFV